MTRASDLRDGMCIRLGSDIYKALHAEMKVGTAKLPSSVHLRLRNLRTGTQTDQRFHPEDKVEDIVVETVAMDYSYADGDNCYFMHPGTFEQVPIPRRMLWPYLKYIDANTRLKVEFYGEEPIDVLFPKTVDVEIASTGAPLHGDVDSAPKAATLANGQEVWVPQFLKTGDRIRIDVETGKYIERLHQ